MPRTTGRPRPRFGGVDTQGDPAPWEGDQNFAAEGTYLEVDAPHRLRYTFGMLQFSQNRDTISVEIASEGTGCVVVFEQSGVDIASALRELAPGVRPASAAGWQQGFDLMGAAWR